MIPTLSATVHTPAEDDGLAPPRRTPPRPLWLSIVLAVGIGLATGLAAAADLRLAAAGAAALLAALTAWVILYRPSRAIFVFMILLPVHQVSMMLVLHVTNSWPLVRMAQLWKDLLIVAVVAALVGLGSRKGRRLQWRQIDTLLLLFTLWNVIVVLISSAPLGIQLLGLRTNLLLLLFYALGRLLPLSETTRRRILLAILLLGIGAGLFALVDRFVLPVDWPARIGLARYLTRDQGDLPGRMGLSWTYWTANGMRRASSFFANPLDYAASAHITGVTALAVYILAPQRRMRRLAALSFVFVVLGLVLSVSRMATIAFGLECLLVLLMTRRAVWIPPLLLLVGVGVVILALANPLVVEHAVQTITFENPSSQGHLLKWLEGLAAMMQHPLGLGLGLSGAIGARLGNQIGGENQYIVFGVELGIPGLLLYVLIQLLSLRYAVHLYLRSAGTIRILALVAFVSRVGIALGGMTAAIESYLFVAYINWWLIGYVVASLPASRRLRRRAPAAQATLTST